MRTTLRNSIIVIFISLTLQSCINKGKIYGDGAFTILKKYIFPRYELAFPIINSETLLYKYDVNTLNPQRSLMGVKFGVSNKQCIDLKTTELKYMHLKLILLNKANDVIVESSAKLEDWVWSYPEYNPEYDEISTCFLYMRDGYFVPKKGEMYSLIIEIRDFPKINIRLRPVIKSIAIYLP
ncbi:hypothetical protein MNBD_GAMMA12-1868 [hydrothermal vent metagenome]|uniref:Lipoprotein n=1 Tax=hydrothermal vent metagenome TaxID=652676 RepID=A0A3B0ZMQ5_9ZZZZ